MAACPVRLEPQFAFMHNTTKKGLSKSRLLNWRQCPKRLWLEVHMPDLRIVTPEAERRFQVGHQVGAIARDLEENGLLIGFENDLHAALAATQDALARHPGRSLFEPAFQHDGLLVRIDLLLPRGCAWDIIEVKSSAGVKDYHHADAAVQTWVADRAGIDVEEVCIGHIDSSFVYPGGGDYRGLIAKTPVTDIVDALFDEVPHWVAGARDTLAGSMPDVAVGSQCNEPFECPFRSFCEPEPLEYPVDLLPDRAGKKLARELAADGYADLREVPPDRMITPFLERVHRVTLNGQAELDRAAAAIINALPWPRYYLDFETIGWTVPVWAGTRPFQALPFQWSCHAEASDGEVFHREFLDTTGEPPMRAFAESLLETLGNEGPILVYSAYEKRILNELAAAYPDLAPALQALVARLVDLQPIAKQHYYHPAMKGSWSIKAVLPTVAPDLDYASLEEVRDGTAAQAAYAEMIDSATTRARREQLEHALREYCKLDTLAMVRLAHFLGSAKDTL